MFDKLSKLTDDKIKLVNKFDTSTSNGVLSKGWYDISGKTCLVKGNSCNSGCKYGREPYSEVLASILADVIGINHIKYHIELASKFPEIKTYDCTHVSICEKLVTDAQVMHYAEYADLCSSGSCNDYFQFLTSQEELIEDVYKMLIFDAVIGNEDRHLNNFDILYSGNSIRLAPIIDNGGSLLALTPSSDLKSKYVCGPDKAKPFRETHERQVHLLKKKFGVIKLCDLSIDDVYFKWYEESFEVLDLLDTKRSTAIKSYLLARLNYYKEFFGGE